VESLLWDQDAAAFDARVQQVGHGLVPLDGRDLQCAPVADDEIDVPFGF
jgi:hypothetical protein